MAIDVAPVISALEDAGVAVAAVGLAVLMVCVAISLFVNLKLIFGFGSGSSSVGSSSGDGSLGPEESVEQWADRMKREDPDFFDRDYRG